MPTLGLIIKGKVQGVFYRARAQEKALELGLTGWIKNLPDGSVEVRATGSESALEQLASWCAQGPSRAQVSEVIRKELPEELFERFEVVR